MSKRIRLLFCAIMLVVVMGAGYASARNTFAESQIPDKGNLDLMFVIDTTSSMGDDITEVKKNVLDIINRVAVGGSHWRIGIVTYRDYPFAPYGDAGDYTSQLNLGFSTDYTEITNAVNAIQIGGGGDNPEAVYAGLTLAFQQPWTAGARKIVVLMGDAPPHDPDPQKGYTRDSILSAAFAADPINIYTIQTADDPNTQQAFQALADGSSGRAFTSKTAADVVDILLATVSSFTEAVALPSVMTPGTLVEVMEAEGKTLSLREAPSLGSAVIEDLAIGGRAHILGGPQYAEGFVWWHVRSVNGNEGWVVEAENGITTLIPLTDTRTVFFREQFYDNRADWETSQTGHAVTSVIRDGLYTVLAAVTDDFEYWVVAPGFTDWSKAPIFDSPYEVQFRFLDVKANSGGYGLVILFDVQHGYQPYKRLIINDNGTWQLFRWTGVREKLAEGTLQDGAVDFADRHSHTVNLRVDTNEYTLFVDGREEASMPSFDPISGTVGFGVARGSAKSGDQITIRFDDLFVRSLGGG
jgi:Mg-chelatase subunit ChlD